VPEAGLEPALRKEGDFKSPASTNFTTRAWMSQKLASTAGFEPATIRLEGGCSIQLSYADMGVANMIVAYSTYIRTE
jgi:hypothetical protein